MRATNHKHYGSEVRKAHAPKTSAKTRKGFKAASFTFAIVAAAAALIVPTTTLAPGVDAYEDSRVASYSVGDLEKFSAVITNNCVEVTTAPATEEVASAEVTTQEETVKAEETVETEPEETKPEETKAEETKAEEKTVSETSETSAEPEETSATEEEQSQPESDPAPAESSDAPVSYSGSALINIANPDPSYSPSPVSLSSYDRAKLERLVMGEAGTMGYEGCALVAQSIRDAMNRSGTSSIDTIISEYQYYGSTAIEPNSDVKNAVSFIFDQNGSAVQHRVLCFYIGSSAWHESQIFVVELDGVRFFDMYV